MDNNTIESIAAFFTGGVPATVVSFHLMDVTIPMIMAVMTGILGGFFALLGKDLYKFIKDKVVKK